MRYGTREDVNGESSDKVLQRHNQGTKSAFKEVRKRKQRFNPISPSVKKDSIRSNERSETRLLTNRLLTNPAYASFQTTYGDMSAIASVQRHRYPYLQTRLGEPGCPGLGVTLPYSTLPFFPHPPRPAIYFRDPFVLAAQNCCAKCGVQFRMTSDLVYHMRTHHKHELANEGNRESKPAEKYKCSVCQESFKEKHHLSRHMTSHDA